MTEEYMAILLPTFFVSVAFTCGVLLIDNLDFNAAVYFILIACILLGLAEFFGLPARDLGGDFIKGIFITNAAVVLALVAGALPGVVGIVIACLAVALMLRAILVLRRIC